MQNKIKKRKFDQIYKILYRRSPNYKLKTTHSETNVIFHIVQNKDVKFRKSFVYFLKISITFETWYRAYLSDELIHGVQIARSPLRV